MVRSSKKVKIKGNFPFLIPITLSLPISSVLSDDSIYFSGPYYSRIVGFVLLEERFRGNVVNGEPFIESSSEGEEGVGEEEETHRTDVQSSVNFDKLKRLRISSLRWVH